MSSILTFVASWMQTLLPGWLRLPDLTFSMPHSAYWLGLILFPPIAMFLVQRSENRTTRARVSPAIGYLLWLWGGFAGLHRFYVKSILPGFVLVCLFLLVLYGNSVGKDARELSSQANNTLRDAEFRIEHFQEQVDKGRSGAEERLAEAVQTYESAQVTAVEATQALDMWGAFVGGVAAIILIFLIVDAVLLPGLIKACARREVGLPDSQEFSVMERGARPDPRREITNGYIRFVDSLSGWSGKFVAYWSMVAVFVYYYEVIARYVFNSPTNWAHESMFLMFGMQYLLSGAYALREDAHVRVDVIFERFSMRTRTLIDIVTSFFFFVFALTLLATGFIFAMNSIGQFEIVHGEFAGIDWPVDILIRRAVWEVSFTEWAIQYWPVKITIALGAMLLLLQGTAKLVRDVTYYAQTRAVGQPGS